MDKLKSPLNMFLLKATVHTIFQVLEILIGRKRLVLFGGLKTLLLQIQTILHRDFPQRSYITLFPDTAHTWCLVLLLPMILSLIMIMMEMTKVLVRMIVVAMFT